MGSQEEEGQDYMVIERTKLYCGVTIGRRFGILSYRKNDVWYMWSQARTAVIEQKGCSMGQQREKRLVNGVTVGRTS